MTNGNRGVEALGRSVLEAVGADESHHVTVFDDGWGVRPDQSGRYEAAVEYAGVRVSRRWHRPESWAHVRVAQAFGGLRNPVARRLRSSDAVLDISGGDSFTDMYGPLRLRIIASPKLAALRAQRPLVLLPQTYGPFESHEGRRLAQRIINRSTLAYARDPASFDRLLEIDNGVSDPATLRQGVDVAFALRARRPPDDVADMLASTTGEPLVGVNVSGLLGRPGATEQFGLAGDYVRTMTDVVTMLARQGSRVMLVPHVHVSEGGGESDADAISTIYAALPGDVRNAVLALRPDLDAAQLKWCIAQTSWFAGSRMHATIAALSSGVPAFGYAYSDKTRGVFDTCGMADHVADARELAGNDAVERISYSFAMRDKTRRQLAQQIGGVVERAHVQLDEILAEVASWRHANGAGAPQ